MILITIAAATTATTWRQRWDNDGIDDDDDNDDDDDDDDDDDVLKHNYDKAREWKPVENRRNAIHKDTKQSRVVVLPLLEIVNRGRKQ